jgi:glutathione S-transferase
MKLYYSPTSPFVRKCLICAQELGLRQRIELVPAAPHPVNRDRALIVFNPLGKVPTLITDQGAVLHDSRVICEYLIALHAELAGESPVRAAGLIPGGDQRWAVLALQALADGILDAAVLCRYETAARPGALRWPDWVAGQLDKVTSGLGVLEAQATHFGARVDLGTISVACALGYLDFRYAELAWRERHPTLARWFDEFATRESMRVTRPPP